ncbi:MULTISPECIES: universal stress protein [Streptomyces]|uniref:Universal stress protein n=1 Tax=Streptomyces fungicidicus TaxID=68203 RepID=A0ACC7XWH1_9ACTN|nr:MULTISPECIES: universal stress protein [Streptomyces]MBO1284074.1 universal stress protein [Streptomyces sampsonii]NVI29947.1 universal stress protein [Streptomyces sp. CAI-17]MBF4134125.1 universal stress protein [Streptomyces albidoflavus]MCX5461411.1 universal stress protein [Streptomyces sp. FT1]NUV73822.1 universal stress protein [Streptomyces fungicidicus]
MSEETTMTPRIVVGVDGSECSMAALRWAVEEARTSGSAVDAVLAWQPPDAWYGLVPPRGEERTAYEARAQEELEGSVEEALGPGPGRPVPIRATAERGHPATVLVRAAEGARLLVVGNRGRGEFREALLGSVGLQCVQHAPCPVVVVR